MKKSYLFLAAMVSVALTGCMNDEYIGENQGTGETTTDAISFGNSFKAVTRAENLTGSDAAAKLGNEFKVYGVKQNKTTTTNYDDVFVNYLVKYSTAQAGNTEYNNGWYYVGAATGQYIKYWDYASLNYHFVAGSPATNFTFKSYTEGDYKGDIKEAAVTGLGGRLDHNTTINANTTSSTVYFAEPKVVGRDNYKNEVEFQFRSTQAKVRVGLYETIPGYKITSISFYNNASPAVTSKYITLNSATANYFQGGSSVEGTLTYNWTTPGYTFVYSTEVGKKPTLGNYWEGGEFTKETGDIIATSSAAAVNILYGKETNKDTKGYFVVLPTSGEGTALTITCDYTLTSLDGSKETIEVKGATATIPAAYTKWKANTAYTYLLKISDKTNGHTGPDDQPEGLFPIIFDAVVTQDFDNTETSFSTPSITVYQNGEEVKDGKVFVTGTSETGTVTVEAYEGTTRVTELGTTEWKYVELTGAFDYGCDYERLGNSGAETSWTDGRLSTVKANKTYVIRCKTSTGTTYFVLVVDAAENGPETPTT